MIDMGSETKSTGNKAENVCKKCGIVTPLLLSGAICFMFWIFAPTDIYVANAQEFWFTYLQMIAVTGVAFAVSFAVLSLVLWLLGKTKIANVVCSIVVSVLVYFYIQGNFVPRNYGVLNGDKIDWSSYTGYSTISIVLLVLFAAVAVLLSVFAKDKVFTICKFASAMLLFAQVMTTTVLLVQNQETVTKNTDSILVTTNGLNDFSSENNIVVVILDTFDAAYMNDMLDSEYKDRTEDLFEDFTYYPNTVGTYPTTRGALPYILTGVWNENLIPYDEYIESAFKQTDIYDVLSENGYKSHIYTENSFFSRDADFENVEIGHSEVNKKIDFAGVILKMVSFNYFPHQLKQYVYTPASDFDKFEASGTYWLYSLYVPEAYRCLNIFEPNISDECNYFKVFHIDGVHPFYTFDENLEEKDNAELTDEILGCYTYLDTLFAMMQEEGIYDNSTIIVMADHGKNDYAQNPLFMIKNVNESHDFQVSDAAMSWEFLADIYKDLASGTIVDEDYIESFNGAEGRRFLYYTWDGDWDSNYLPGIIEFYFYNSCNAEDAVETYNRYFDLDMFRYELGTEISFATTDDTTDTAYQYELSGFYDCEGDRTWSRDSSSEMLFVLPEDCSGNLMLNYTHGTFSSQNVKIYVNDNYLCEYVAGNLVSVNVVIPEEYITDSSLVIRFEYPYALCPQVVMDTNDDRVLAICMFSMSISQTDEEFTGEAYIEDLS